jgi:hypothetical protein
VASFAAGEAYGNPPVGGSNTYGIVFYDIPYKSTGAWIGNWTQLTNVGQQSTSFTIPTLPNYANDSYFYIVLRNPNTTTESFVYYYSIEVIKNS